MNFLKNIKISTKVFSGFAVVILMLLVISIVGFSSLKGADKNFEHYRNLARQTDQAGLIQANMLMTRMFAKNFIISPTAKSIEGVHKRAQETLDLIPQAREMATDPKFIKIIDDVEKELKDYVSYFEEVTQKQDRRNELVNGTLNVTGPMMERKLSEIMKSAFQDGDTEAAYRAGITLRNLLLARLYVVKFLVKNDESSYKRVQVEMANMIKNQNVLMVNIQNPVRRKLAMEIAQMSKLYGAAFKKTHKAIRDRNEIIKNELDRIGPFVANEIEKLDLKLKSMQDDLGPRASSEIQHAVNITVIVSVVSVLVGVIAAWLIGTGIANPVKNMTNAMASLAGGDKAIEIPAQDHKDEIGSMASALQVFKENMIEADKVAKQQAKDQATRIKRAEAVEDLTKNFDTAVSGVIDSVAAAATEMDATAVSMSSTADQTSKQSNIVAAASDEASANVQTVASATEELSSSISEISRQVSQSSQISSTAVDEVGGANDQVQSLAVAAQKIGDVVALITDIADQTNLLALNATIEAARAGDAGKGFAVVASEVKNLANQTAKATEEISTQIDGIQGATQGAVDAIGSIGKIINEMNEIASNIASSVEEQGAATQEIARNVEEAAVGTRDVSSNITSVTEAATETGQAANTVREASHELSTQTETLKGIVDQFLKGVRAV